MDRSSGRRERLSSLTSSMIVLLGLALQAPSAAQQEPAGNQLASFEWLIGGQWHLEDS